MDSTNTSRGVKRPAEYELTDGASPSNRPKVPSGTVGANVTTYDNSTVSIGGIFIHHHVGQQQSASQYSPTDIEFQVDDPVASFRGRDDELNTIKRAFDQPKNRKLFKLVAICGYGGIGKSECARMYIKQHRSDFQNVIWIYGEFEKNIRDSFDKLQRVLDRLGYPCTDHPDVYKYFNSDKCIIIFDNVENMKSIKSFLPKKDNNSIFLITSQYSTWSPHEAIQLNVLYVESAANIIKAVLDTHEIEITESQLRGLVCRFERIPLVLQIVAGYITQEVLELKLLESDYNIEDIVLNLEVDCKLVIEEYPDFSSDSYSKSVYAALSKTLDKIEKMASITGDMLRIAAYLDADYINEKVLKNLLKTEDQTFKKALANLIQFSLFQKTWYNIRIHRTVQQCIQYYCREKLKSNRYYLVALSVLLNNNKDYREHHKTIFRYGENDLATFTTFYNQNKCYNLYKSFVESATCKVLSHLLDNADLITMSEFLCEAAPCSREDINIMQMLLERGVNFNVRDDKGYNALYYACLPRDNDTRNKYSRRWKTIKILIKEGADVNSQDSNLCTILHTLCDLEETNFGKDEDILNNSVLLIKQGADPKMRNCNNQTPADLAQKYKLKLTFKLLHSVISGYEYIGHIAVQCNQLKFLDWLTRKKICNISECDDAGCTVLHLLANLEQQDDKFNENLLNITWRLVTWYNADLSIKNKDGERAEDVARRCGRETLADFFNAWAPPGRLIYQSVHRQKIEHFSFVSKDTNLVNDQDDTGCTLLHALCDLDEDNDNELELDIIKLSVDLVIRHRADVHIKNNENEIAAGVARRRGRLLLADFLDSSSSKGEDLIYLVVKHKRFELIKYVWRSYIDLTLKLELYKISNQVGCTVLQMFCAMEESTVTDVELISVFESLHLKLLAQYSKEEYQKAIEIAEQHGRKELADWMTRFDMANKTSVNNAVVRTSGIITNVADLRQTSCEDYCDVIISDGVEVFGNRKVFGNVKVFNSDVVFDNDLIFGHLTVSDSNIVFNIGKVWGPVSVSGGAIVFDNSNKLTNCDSRFTNVIVAGEVRVSDGVVVFNNANVAGNIIACDGFVILHNMYVAGDIKVVGDVTISGDVEIYGNISVTGNVTISNNVTYFADVEVTGDVNIYSGAAVSKEFTVLNKGRKFKQTQSASMIWSSW